MSIPNNFIGCLLKALLGSVVASYVIGLLYPLVIPFVVGMDAASFNLFDILWLAIIGSPLFISVFWYVRRRRRQAQLQAEDGIGQNLRQGRTAFYLADDGEVVFVEEPEAEALSEGDTETAKLTKNSR